VFDVSARGRLRTTFSMIFHLSKTRGIEADWTALVDGWLAAYRRRWSEVSAPGERYVSSRAASALAGEAGPSSKRSRD